MPPKQSTSKATSTGQRASTSSTSRATAAANKKRAAATAALSDDDLPPRRSEAEGEEDEEEDEDEGEQAKTIPPALLTRLLHEFFSKEGTRVTRDANEAVAKYMDVFVREAIARSVAEREGGGFLEVRECGREGRGGRGRRQEENGC